MTTRCFNATPHEAKALHEGRATAVVRRMEPQPIDQGDRWEWRPNGSKEVAAGVWVPSCVWAGRGSSSAAGVFGLINNCPFGRVGDTLLFREAASINDTAMPSLAHHFQGEVVYKDDSTTILLDVPLEEWRCRYENNRRQVFSTASMPRWAVRTRRVIASIDVVRVAEMNFRQVVTLGWDCCEGRFMGGPSHDEFIRNEFRSLYESRHGKGSWAADFAWLIGLKEAEA